MKRFALIALTVIAGTALQARAIQSFSHDIKTKTANQWETVDIQFAAQNLPEQPADAELTAVLTCGEETLSVQGFYNGGKNYTVRFCPGKTGEWSYQLSSSLKGLDGVKGRISVQPALEGRKGGITVNPESNREFQYADGSKYYPICFEVDWLFALDAENPDDIPVTRMFVNTLAENGYNQAIMNVFAFDVDWKKDDKLTAEFEYGSPKAFPFEGTNENPVHSKLNPEYFRRLDRVIDELDQKGIAAHLMIYVWNKRVNWPTPDSEEDNRYFDYVVKRYQGFPNLVWDVSKEALAYGHDDVDYITRRIDRLRKLDAHKRLVTVHDYNYCAKNPDKLDFISVQLWQSELTRLMLKVRDDFKNQPILNIEHGGYEESPYVVFPGSYTSPEVCLERAYNCVFAGTYPTHYWQGAAWNVIIPDIAKMPESERPKLEYYRHMADFVKKYTIGSLKPGDKKSNCGFCLHNGDNLFIYYVPKEAVSIGLNLPKTYKGRFMNGIWFDPFTGKYAQPDRKEITAWPNYKKPESDGFAILIIEVEP